MAVTLQKLKHRLRNDAHQIVLRPHRLRTLRRADRLARRCPPRIGRVFGELPVIDQPAVERERSIGLESLGIGQVEGVLRAMVQADRTATIRNIVDEALAGM